MRRGMDGGVINDSVISVYTRYIFLIHLNRRERNTQICYFRYTRHIGPVEFAGNHFGKTTVKIHQHIISNYKNVIQSRHHEFNSIKLIIYIIIAAA